MRLPNICRNGPEFRRGVHTALPMMIGFVPIGLVLGAQASQKGLSAIELPLMTGLNFAGGSEFAAIALWTSPPPLLLIAAMTLLINSRHLLMSATLTPYVQHLPKRTVLAALFCMCDESWALGYADARAREAAGTAPAFSLPFYLGASGGLYASWVTFSALGVLIGPAVGNLAAYGFDMAFPAIFLVLLSGMWRGVRAALPWLASLAVAVLTYRLVPGAWYVPAGAIAGLCLAYFWPVRS
jgi:4-azaleucine resistance transporter AzlC